MTAQQPEVLRKGVEMENGTLTVGAAADLLRKSIAASALATADPPRPEEATAQLLKSLSEAVELGRELAKGGAPKPKSCGCKPGSPCDEHMRKACGDAYDHMTPEGRKSYAAKKLGLEKGGMDENDDPAHEATESAAEEALEDKDDEDAEKAFTKESSAGENLAKGGAAVPTAPAGPAQQRADPAGLAAADQALGRLLGGTAEKLEKAGKPKEDLGVLIADELLKSMVEGYADLVYQLGVQQARTEQRFARLEKSLGAMAGIAVENTKGLSALLLKSIAADSAPLDSRGRAIQTALDGVLLSPLRGGGPAGGSWTREQASDRLAKAGLNERGDFQIALMKAIKANGLPNELLSTFAGMPSDLFLTTVSADVAEAVTSGS